MKILDIHGIACHRPKSMFTVISQPRYLPSLNYIQRLCQADPFVIFDTVQRQSRGWENRNRILANGDLKWLSIPISSTSREVISSCIITEFGWIQSHKSKIYEAYKNSSFFDPAFIEIYYSEINNAIFNHSRKLKFVDLIEIFTKNLAKIFSFCPKLMRSSELNIPELEKGPKHLLETSRAVQTKIYVSGPNGRAYGVAETFQGTGVEVLFHEFDHPVYQQSGAIEFVPYYSFFDALFNCGIDSVKAWIKTPMKMSS